MEKKRAVCNIMEFTSYFEASNPLSHFNDRNGMHFEYYCV
jgi:hypothetical protein